MEKNGFHKPDDSKSFGTKGKKVETFTILVIDGVADNPGLFTEFLKTQGHFVVRAESEADSMEKTRKFLPNLILLGCDMSGISCLDLLPKLLQIDPEAAVVMVASHPSTKDTVTAMNLGAVNFLELPLNLSAVKLAIDNQKVLSRSMR